jgi:predicted transcriptional regulator
MSKPGIHVIARFLRKILQNPQLSPTQVAAYSGINYYTAKQILALGFVEKVKTGKKKTRLKLTEKGKRFLEHYQEIERLLPF